MLCVLAEACVQVLPLMMHPKEGTMEEYKAWLMDNSKATLTLEDIKVASCEPPPSAMLPY